MLFLYRWVRSGLESVGECSILANLRAERRQLSQLLVGIVMTCPACNIFSIKDPAPSQSDKSFESCSYQQASFFGAAPESDSLHPACTTSACEQSGSAVTFSYCCNPSSWAQCHFSTFGQGDAVDAAQPSFDISRFDADNGNIGYLEVVFCLSGTIRDSELNLLVRNLSAQEEAAYADSDGDAQWLRPGLLHSLLRSSRR